MMHWFVLFHSQCYISSKKLDKYYSTHFVYCIIINYKSPYFFLILFFVINVNFFSTIVLCNICTVLQGTLKRPRSPSPPNTCFPQGYGYKTHVAAYGQSELLIILF